MQLLHLATAFADKADHRDVRIDIARQHRQQYRLTDAGTGEDAHALAAAAGQEGIECADPEIERFAHPLARIRRRRCISERHWRGALFQRSLSVDRFPHRVEDAAEPGRRRPHLACGVGDHGAATTAHAFETGKRHHHGIAAGEADHLARNEARASSFDYNAGADRHGVNRTDDLDHQAADPYDAAIYVDAIDIADLFGEGLHCENLKF